jgi:hypothetical protein
LEAAFRIISMGCDVSQLTPPGTMVEHWDDVPAPSVQLARARDVTYTHVERLVEELTQARSQSGAFSPRTE